MLAPNSEQVDQWMEDSHDDTASNAPTEYSTLSAHVDTSSVVPVVVPLRSNLSLIDPNLLDRDRDRDTEREASLVPNSVEIKEASAIPVTWERFSDAKAGEVLMETEKERENKTKMVMIQKKKILSPKSESKQPRQHRSSASQNGKTDSHRSSHTTRTSSNRSISSHDEGFGSMRSADMLTMSIDLSQCQSDISMNESAIRSLSQKVNQVQQVCQELQSLSDTQHSKVMQEIYVVKNRQEEFNTDMTNLTAKIGKIVNTHNKNNAKSNELYNEVEVGFKQFRQQHDRMKKWIYKTVDDMQISYKTLSTESREIKDLMDGSFEYTLGKVEKFFLGNHEREKKYEMYYEESRLKLNDAMVVIEKFNELQGSYVSLMHKVEGYDALKTTAERLIKRLNQLGFDEGIGQGGHKGAHGRVHGASIVSSLASSTSPSGGPMSSSSRRMIWEADITTLRYKLQLLNMSCMPIALPVVNDNDRPCSTPSKLVVRGMKDYSYRLELGESPMYPDYLGIYIRVEGEVFPICLEDTFLTFLGKTFALTAQDMCLEPMRTCFKCLISHADARRLMTSNSIIIECEINARLAK